jgi:hypothetical protein
MILTHLCIMALIVEWSSVDNGCDQQTILTDRLQRAHELAQQFPI